MTERPKNDKIDGKTTQGRTVAEIARSAVLVTWDTRVAAAHESRIRANREVASLAHAAAAGTWPKSRNVRSCISR